MARKLTCPACGNTGTINQLDPEHAFITRGQVDGTTVFKCKSCGNGIFCGVFFGRAKLIPDSTLAKMKKMWKNNFNEEW